MSSTATVRMVSPEEISAQGSSEVPHVRLPDRSRHFPEREMRLRQLARQHPMGDYLGFMAEVAHAQQQALEQMPEVPLPTLDDLGQATRQGRAGLAAADWPRHAAWQQALRGIVQALAPVAPAATRPVLDALAQADSGWLEQQAQAVLDFPGAGLDVASAPLIGAALQVCWVHMLTQLQARHPGVQASALFGRTDDATHCPCCGSEPVASTMRDAGAAQSQRYMHCTLCGAEWHVLRSQCGHCLQSGQLAYQALALADAEESGEDQALRTAKAAIQAEECGHCRHYVKLLHTGRDRMLDPVADDLASLTLDLLMADAGLQRHGRNMALVFHDSALAPPDAPAAPPPGMH